MTIVDISLRGYQTEAILHAMRKKVAIATEEEAERL
jgi:hypothetical protein